MKWKDIKIFGVEKGIKHVVAYFTTKTIQIMLWQDMVLLGALKICNANIPFSVSLSCTHQTHTDGQICTLTYFVLKASDMFDCVSG